MFCPALLESGLCGLLLRKHIHEKILSTLIHIWIPLDLVGTCFFVGTTAAAIFEFFRLSLSMWTCCLFSCSSISSFLILWKSVSPSQRTLWLFALGVVLNKLVYKRIYHQSLFTNLTDDDNFDSNPFNISLSICPDSIRLTFSFLTSVRSSFRSTPFTFDAVVKLPSRKSIFFKFFDSFNELLTGAINNSSRLLFSLGRKKN